MIDDEENNENMKGKKFINKCSDKNIKKNTQGYGIGLIFIIGSVIIGMIASFYFAFGYGEISITNLWILIPLIISGLGLIVLLYFQNANTKCQQTSEEKRPFSA